MSFFKKNKSKSKSNRLKETRKSNQAELEKEVADMDRERHLDFQLEELTARLNIKSNSLESEAAETQPDTAPVNLDETNLDEAKFLTQSLDKFATPNFSTNVAENTKNIDVTIEDVDTEDLNTEDINTDDLNTEDETSASTSPTSTITQDNSASMPPEQTTVPADITPTASQETVFPDVETDITLSAPNRLDMSAMRLDVAKISSDIQSGEEIYRRATQRVEGLMSFVEKAEVDFSILNRLEPENRRLKAKLRTSSSEVQSYKGKIDLLTSDLEDYQDRLTEKTKQYETAYSKLTTAANSLQEYERLLKKSKDDTERSALAIERYKTALSVEGKENKVLREKVNELSVGITARQAEFLEASKIVESLRSDCADFRDQADTFRIEAQDLRVTLNTAKRQNNAMKSEMQSLHEDIKTFKTQYEFNVINREDQITDMEEQIAFLAKELDLKTEMVKSATDDASTLRRVRNEQDIERDTLEKKLTTANNELKDIATIFEERNTENLKGLEITIEEFKAEILRRDEAAQHSLKETSELQRQYTLLQMERKELQSRFERQTVQLENVVTNNPAAALEEQIEALKKQLSVKDDIVKSAALDVAKLREDGKHQTIKQRELEDIIHTQKFQLEAAHKAILESKQNESELDQKYNDIAAALSVNQSRRRTEGRAESPDIAPDISDEFDALSGDDVEDRIMDYKFGIRKNIV